MCLIIVVEGLVLLQLHFVSTTKWFSKQTASCGYHGVTQQGWTGSLHPRRSNETNERLWIGTNKPRTMIWCIVVAHTRMLFAEMNRLEISNMTKKAALTNPAQRLCRDYRNRQIVIHHEIHLTTIQLEKVFRKCHWLRAKGITRKGESVWMVR